MGFFVVVFVWVFFRFCLLSCLMLLLVGFSILIFFFKLYLLLLFFKSGETLSGPPSKRGWFISRIYGIFKFMHLHIVNSLRFGFVSASSFCF